MRKFLQEFFDFFRKGDMILLALCILTTVFGLVIISSVTNHIGATRFVIIQLVAALIGIFLYAVISSIDLDAIMEYRLFLVIFNCLFLMMLVPFGVDHGTGNKSWLDIPGLPFEIQVAEILKTTYILIMASVMASHQNRLSNWKSVMHMVFHLGLLIGLNMVLSKDLGVSLIFVFIFIGMTFAGGVGKGWFIATISAIAVCAPFLWPLLAEHQQNRFLVLFRPDIDPTATGIRWHSNQALLSLTGGGLTGQGLYNGRRTASGSLFAQRTDYIFSAIGEELGFIGCMAVIILEFAIIARIIYVGIRTPDFARRVVCFGAAAALIFQVTINIGMNLGVMPVIGLTLPFISYGGSSILSLYAMLGLVSGVCARPSPGKQGMYVQPPR
ncbi:MAG: FtsW/RodA/SpoVE family cell cycle protein [Oscillospiraceae bacterium]|nr:FtsW/RodA/SpoVE family cell cycle protein [Oscillospiraceae bacterium]